MAIATGIDELVRTLVTVRDWLRYAVGRFNRAGLSYGHGTSNALDEAAFLILEGLRLPIDDINPWLDARLLEAERHRLAELIEARVRRRVPAPYLVGAAYIQGRRFHVDERVIVPRSYIGELLVSDGLSALIEDRAKVKRVLDLCTGSGCLAILAAEAFPEAQIDACDISADALAVAGQNVASHGLARRIRLLQGDLLAPADGGPYDLIIANPPYVAAAEVEAFPPEHRAEPILAHLGGTDGLDLVRRILAEAPAYLTPTGALIVEIGTARPLIEAEWPDLPFLWLDSAESEGEVFALSAGDLRPRERRKAAARGKAKAR